jgi:hypothetical protein
MMSSAIRDPVDGATLLALASRMHLVNPMTPYTPFATPESARLSTQTETTDGPDIRSVMDSIRRHLCLVEQVVNGLPHEVRAEISARLTTVECRLDRLSKNIGTLVQLTASSGVETAPALVPARPQPRS